MPNVVRAAVVQTAWTGDQDSMIAKNIDFARQAADQNAQVLCFQELFAGPYFCQVEEERHFEDAEPIPSGPTTQIMLARARDTEMSLIVPIFEQEAGGVFYNSAAVIDADGAFLGRYRSRRQSCRRRHRLPARRSGR